MNRIEHNLATGETSTVTLTPQEEADAQARTTAEANDPVRLQAVADEAEKLNTKTNTTTQYLATHTNAEIEALIRSQINADGVTNLATAQAAIKNLEGYVVRLALLAAVDARREMR